ncbi:unannotated protein [freshwater metagenome]|uniref:Unannotated protein n=1 Tax=freshwater metagenome TaxID=449393 RepID=A0A6J7D679_9ZZZZ|nr:hypothetical protein [Actinomycetota bacterium]
MSESVNESNAGPEVEPSSPPSALAGERQRPQRRLMAFVLCAAVAAGGAGFIGGYKASRSSLSNAASTRSGAEQAPLAPSANDSTATPGTATAPGAPPMAGDSKMSSAVAGSGGQYSPGAYAEEPQQLVAQRTTASGITIRAHRQDFGDQMSDPYAGQYNGWKPAGWCFPTGQLRLSIVTASAVNLSGAPWYSEPKDGVAISTFAAGYVESSPVFGAVAQVGNDITSITFTTASGLTDTTAPTDGLALLAVNGPIEDAFTMTLGHGDGTVTTIDAADLTAQYSGTDYHTGCEPPPPALPAAGAQPADPAAAEAAVRESWRISRDFAGTDGSVRITYVDDPTGIQDAWKALSDGQYVDAATSATQPIAELVFTSPTEAWFRYDVLTSISNFYNRYGMARLGADGVWRITRQTVCQDLSLAPGIGCTPTVETLLPPSAANDPRYGQPIPIDGGVVTPMPVEGRPAVDPSFTVTS